MEKDIKSVENLTSLCHQYQGIAKRPTESKHTPLHA